MSAKGIDHITRNEFEQALGETVENIIEVQEAFNMLKTVLNVQAEVLGLHRYILERFVPTPQLEAAAKEYKDIRQRQIATEATPPGNA